MAFITLRPAHAASTDDFVTTWKTDNPGVTNNTSVQIRSTGITSSFDIDWNNDGVFDDLNVYGMTHDYGTPGTYTIRIRPHGSFHLSTQFSDAGKLVAINQWGTAPWASMSNAFNGANNMVVSATDAPNLTQATDMSYAFYGASLFNPSNISSWDVSHITNMSDTFDSASSFNQPLSGWNTSSVTNMHALFQNATAFNQPIGGWDTTNVTDMSQLFTGASSFNQPLSGWNTSSVTDMGALFNGATAFNQNISTWNTGNVTAMGSMFNSARSFNQDISAWNTPKVTDLSYMFQNATSFNQPMNNFNVSQVTNMGHMFDGAAAFNQGLASWNTSNVTNMSTLFQNATAFNQPIGGWDTSHVTDMSGMFNGATAFNQDISQWNTANVASVDYMFNGASSFKQPLGSLNIAGVRFMSNMLVGTAYGGGEYDATIRGWSTQTLQHNVTAWLPYCTAQAERDYISQTFGWSMTGYQLCTTTFSDGTQGTSVAAAAAVTNTSVQTLTLQGATLGSYSLSCTQPSPDNAYFTLSGTSGQTLLLNANLSYDTPLDANHDNVYNVCIRTILSDGHGFDTQFTVTILPPQRVTGVSFSTDASNRKVLAVNGQSFLAQNETIAKALTTSLVRLNGVDLQFCSDGFGITAQQIVDAYSSAFPDVANQVTDTPPCYWLVGANGITTNGQVLVWLSDNFDITARGTVSINGSPTYIFNAGVGGNLPPAAQANGAKPLDQHPIIAAHPTFSGVATPGANVTVTVHSDPVTCTATADANGDWDCTLPISLPAGEHTVYVQVVNPDNSVENLGPYPVTVAAASVTSTASTSTASQWQVVQAVGGPLAAAVEKTADAEPTSPSTPPTTPKTATEAPQQTPTAKPAVNLWWLWGSIVIVAGGAVLIMLARRRHKTDT